MQISKALHDLGRHAKDVLVGAKLEDHSPKFARILQRLETLQPQRGHALLYSQYRTVEGVTLLAAALRANGWAEVRVRSRAPAFGGSGSNEETTWELWDSGKGSQPRFAVMGSVGETDEKTESGQSSTTLAAQRALLALFNEDVSALPQGLVGAAKSLRASSNKPLISVLLVTGSGAEGLNLKGVRQVHLLEPFWHMVRLRQVVGRAVRAGSHSHLPAAERNVDVFVYTSSLTSEQLQSAFVLRSESGDRGLSSDEYVLEVARRKAGLINAMSGLLVTTAVDCGLHNKVNRGQKCANLEGTEFDVDLQEMMK
jgi:hypothetical protein